MTLRPRLARVLSDSASRTERAGEQPDALLIREPPPKPDQDCIPFLGDHALYEQVIRVTAKDKIALNVGNTWYRAEPSETEEQAYARLKRACFRVGRDLEEVQLGLPSHVGGIGISISHGTEPPQTSLFPPGDTTVPAPPVTPQTAPQAPVTVTLNPPQPQMPLAPIIRQSNGAKSGINLLGDIERWGLPDENRVNLATLTFRGLSVKELRELCTKLPARLQADLQITSDSEQEANQTK